MRRRKVRLLALHACWSTGAKFSYQEVHFEFGNPRNHTSTRWHAPKDCFTRPDISFDLMFPGYYIFRSELYQSHCHSPTALAITPFKCFNVARR